VSPTPSARCCLLLPAASACRLSVLWGRLQPEFARYGQFMTGTQHNSRQVSGLGPCRAAVHAYAAVSPFRARWCLCVRDGACAVHGKQGSSGLRDFALKPLHSGLQDICNACFVLAWCTLSCRLCLHVASHSYSVGRLSLSATRRPAPHAVSALACRVPGCRRACSA
jgi:hypothetical protein